MRALLKHNGDLYNVYWVTRGANGIFGWFAGGAVLPAMFRDAAIPSDVHFTYPSDGNLHYTFTYRSPTGSPVREKRVFHDHVSERLFTEQGPRALPRRPRNEETPDELLLITYRARALDEYSDAQIFQFPLVAIPTTGAGALQNMYPRIDGTRSSDLVIDIAKYAPGGFNISVILSGPCAVPVVSKAPEQVDHVVEKDGSLTITLQSLFVPT